MDKSAFNSTVDAFGMTDEQLTFSQCKRVLMSASYAFARFGNAWMNLKQEIRDAVMRS